MDISKLKGVSLDGARWVAIPTMPGVSLKVRGNSYPDYLDEVSRLTRKAAPESFEDGALKFTAQRLIQGAAMAKHLLLDWDGITTGKKAQPYDAAIATALLTTPEAVYQDNSLFSAVEYAARQVGAGHGTEELVKN